MMVEVNSNWLDSITACLAISTNTSKNNYITHDVQIMEHLKSNQ